jgi:hypothetical protein
VSPWKCHFKEIQVHDLLTLECGDTAKNTGISSNVSNGRHGLKIRVRGYAQFPDLRIKLLVLPILFFSFLICGCGNSVTLNAGTGNAGRVRAITTSNTALVFGNVLLHSSASQSLILTSSGTAPVTIKSISATGNGFAVSTAALPQTLGPDQTLAVQVSFHPDVAGSVSGTVAITSDSSIAATTVVTLTGTGASPGLSANPTSLPFGSVTVNTNATQTLTLISSGTAPVTISAISVTGSGFAVSTPALPQTLSPGQSLAVQVNFQPKTAGPGTGTVAIASDSTTGATTSVSLSANGTNSANPILSVSPTALDFGDTQVGTFQTLTLGLSSTGTSPVTINSVGISGAAFTYSGATFPVTLAPGVAVSLQVKFAPGTAGSANGTLQITSNSASGSSTVVNMAGYGTQVQHQVDLSWAAPAQSAVPVTGYNIYRQSGSNSSFQLLQTSQIAQTTYTDPTVISGASYIYYVTSVDSSGDESAPSNQASVTIP